MWKLFAQAFPQDLPPPSWNRQQQWQEGYEELMQMQNELKIWEMVIDYLSSGDFLLVILTVFFGIALVKSVGVVDRYLNVTKKGNNDE